MDVKTVQQSTNLLRDIEFLKEILYVQTDHGSSDTLGHWLTYYIECLDNDFCLTVQFRPSQLVFFESIKGSSRCVSDKKFFENLNQMLRASYCSNKQFIKNSDGIYVLENA